MYSVEQKKSKLQIVGLEIFFSVALIEAENEIPSSTSSLVRESCLPSSIKVEVSQKASSV